jgi:hypothetical protein
MGGNALERRIAVFYRLTAAPQTAADHQQLSNSSTTSVAAGQNLLSNLSQRSEMERAATARHHPNAGKVQMSAGDSRVCLCGAMKQFLPGGTGLILIRIELPAQLRPGKLDRGHVDDITPNQQRFAVARNLEPSVTDLVPMSLH